MKLESKVLKNQNGKSATAFYHHIQYIINFEVRHFMQKSTQRFYDTVTQSLWQYRQNEVRSQSSNCSHLCTLCCSADIFHQRKMIKQILQRRQNYFGSETHICQVLTALKYINTNTEHKSIVLEVDLPVLFQQITANGNWWHKFSRYKSYITAKCTHNGTKRILALQYCDTQMHYLRGKSTVQNQYSFYGHIRVNLTTSCQSWPGIC